jgi:twitching motility protein PilT
MRNASGLTNLTARPVSVEQLIGMLRGSPVASMIPEHDATAAPVDVQIGTRRVRVQVGRRGDEILVRISKPEGVPAITATQPMAKVAEPPQQQRPKGPTGMRIRTPTPRSKPVTKSPIARTKTASTAARTKTASTAARTKTPTRTKRQTTSPRTKSGPITLPSPASVVRSQAIAVTPPPAMSTSGLLAALKLDDLELELEPPYPQAPAPNAGGSVPNRLEIEVDAPTLASSPGIVVPPPSTEPISVLPTQPLGRTPVASGAFADLVAAARKRGASDLHVSANRVTSIRVGADLVALSSTEPLSPPEAEALLRPLLDHDMRQTLAKVGYVDFALEAPGGGRLRANICRQQQGLKGTFRLALPAPLPLDKLGLPPELAKVVSHHQGLVVIAGPSGHGKTTTLAALVDLVNSTKPHHILTIEDPVELVHPRKMAVISQREVGRHTESFARGLKASLREDPDVIVIGELRDRESVEIALTAAETGHLVLATMSTPSAAKTIDRLIDMFPPEEHNQVRASVAGALRAIVAQRLLPRKGGGGVVPAVELVTGVLPLAVMIREDKMYQLPNLMQRGRALGMIRLEESIAELMRAGKIDGDGTQPMWKPGK